MAELKVLISRQDIATRIAELGEQITKDFTGQSVIFVGVLKGAAIFLADLARQVQLDSTFDFIGVSSYGNRPSPASELKSGWDSTGEVKLTKDVDQSIKDKNIVLVEDILDTGLTLSFLKRMLMQHRPRSLRVATLLDKPERRIEPIQAEYVGFSIPNHFVIGYGMDYAERFRNLPDICIFPPEAAD
jgi:hypoxanthine phosphoribosyltransferase